VFVTQQSTFLGYAPLAFFSLVKYAGELRIIALREEKTDTYKKPPPTLAQAVGVLSYNKA